MQLTNRAMIVALSVLAGFAIPFTWLSTSADKDKPNQPAGQNAPSPPTIVPAALEILDSTTTLTLQVQNPPNPRGTTTIYLRNDGDQDIKKLTFSAALQDENAKSYSLSLAPSPDEAGEHIGVIESQNKTLSGRSVQPFELLIKLDRSLPIFDGDDSLIPHTLSGYLTVKGDEKLVKNRPLKLIPSAPSLQAAYPIWFGLICSAVIVVVSILIFRLRLNQRMGLPDWTASGSLATNLTASGTILTTLIASTALPATTHILQKGEYNTLALLFGVLVLLAPIIYGSIRVPSNDPNATPQSPNEGYVGMFLLSSVVTLWGVFGQLSTVWYLIGELWEARYMPHGAVAIFRTCIAVVAVLLFIYAFVGIRVKVHKSKTRVTVPLPTVAKAEIEVAKQPEVATQALPKWRLL